MLLIRILLLSFVCAACNSKGNQESGPKGIALQLVNMPIDSCSFRINHIITGKEVFHREGVDLSKPIHLPALEDDVYIAVFSWPRTLISHQVVRNKGFDKANGVDEFELTKPLYIDKANADVYRIEVTNEITLEDLEAQGAGVLQFKNIACKECDLADRYWKLYSDFFDRKAVLIDSAKQLYYGYIDKDDLNKGNKAFLALEELKTHFVKDDLLDREVQGLVNAHPDNRVSTFFLFYQLYNHREFDKFKETFELLKADAQQGKYYRMVKKQYDELR